MKISGQILRPFIEKIEVEWKELYDELSANKTGEAFALRPSVEDKIKQLGKFKAAIETSDKNLSKESSNYREALRFLKLDLRATQRKWRRHLVSNVRTQKRRARFLKNQHSVSNK